MWNNKTALAGYAGEWEILVIDDGSTDSTAERAANAGARVVRRVENGGYGAALKTGVTSARGEWIALLDADGSYNPADVPRLLAAVRDLPPIQKPLTDEGVHPTDGCCYDMVCGVRRGENGTWPGLRRPVKWLIRKLAEWVSGRTIPDLNTGMRVFRRDVVRRYAWVLPDGFSCSTSMTLALLCNGHAVRYEPIGYRPRVGDSKFHPVRETAKYLATVFRVVMYFRPLRVFVPLALLIGTTAAVTGTYHVVRSPTGLHDADVLLAMLAVAVLVVGLLADVIVAQRRNP